MAICLLAVGALLCGCASDSPNAPDVPGGGEDYVLDEALFASAVAPILSAKGCDAGGDCHGGGIRGTYELSPQTAKDTEFDFRQSSQQVNGYDPLASPFLTEALADAAGGTAHAFKAFASTDDADWQALRDWVLAGELQ
jgi:hypothetical protein